MFLVRQLAVELSFVVLVFSGTVSCIATVRIVQSVRGNTCILRHVAIMS